MSARRAVPLAVVLATALASAAGAQHPAHRHEAAAPATGPHALAQTCDGAFEDSVRDGRGFGMAFAADQQGYPGPLHVLELKDRLALTAEQEARAQALLASMYAESRPKSARLIAAERRLRDLFAARPPSEADVRAAVADAEAARAEVRLVHLAYHLKMRDALTEGQRRTYQEARWPASTR